ncbi:NAD(P)/FAD-dependent oxidoreductase [Danxiaibacter flavus]|uniref:Tryptophan 2-monooxygenase n=1 Tax=Danxiaibacter flavus TaxID=3049108 RepID=A0ABV3ZFG9_9BACT|nr:NAD(P)/FAD-dependent oxidoreductase [Chitinophagaceae bacterium DXS]
MKEETIIIIGAGAAGLLAAKELSSSGFKVIILEAAGYVGGRIKTTTDVSFEHLLEEGAEFVHGKLPLTLQLLKEAKISFHRTKGKMLRNTNGRWHEQHEIIEGSDRLMAKMHEYKHDVTLSTFLEENFRDAKYEPLRRSVQKFAEGFDLADIQQVSMFALRDEWEKEEGDQYRIENGYAQLTDFLAKQCIANGATIHISSVANKISWKKDEVLITTTTGEYFTASKVIVTVSLGVLSATGEKHNVLAFMPAIDNYLKAAQEIGFGSVTKIFLRFSEPFWNKDTGFILSEEAVPTWWTQLPRTDALLTGWLPSTSAVALNKLTEPELIELSMQSLANIFSLEVSFLKQRLISHKVSRWQTFPFTKGAYSYAKVQSIQARQLLNTPLENTVFFAGEGVYDGEYPGTVEAALVSGQNVADKIRALKLSALGFQL